MRYGMSILFCLFFCSIQKATASGKNDLEEHKLKGKVKSITTTMWEGSIENGRYKKGRQILKYFGCYNEDGMAIISKGSCDIHYSFSNDGSRSDITLGGMNSILVYDNNKRKIKQLLYDCKDSLQDSIIYAYDLNGNCNSQKTYSPYGKLTDQITYRYNGRNKCIEQRSVYDTTQYIQFIRYNDKMNVIEYSTFAGNKKLSRHEYYYNGNGKLIEERFYFGEEKPSWNKYLYDKQSLLTEVANYDSNGSIKAKRCYVYDNIRSKTGETAYDYAEDGNVKTTRRKFANHATIVTEDVYKNKERTIHKMFNKYGNCILSVEYFYNDKGKISYKKYTKTTYDSRNNIVTVEGRMIEGNGSFSTPQSSKYKYDCYKESHTYEYDKTGNLIRQIDLASGVPELITEIEITYY